MPRGVRSRILPILVLIPLATGCESQDDRLVEITREASNRQAEQNQQIAQHNQQLAEATKKLVQADAEARKELVSLQRQVQAERAMIGRQRDDLEQERRQIANARYWDSLLGNAVGSAVVVLAALLPFILCWYLLHGLRKHGDEQAIGELLAMELIQDSPVLLPGPKPAETGERQLPPLADRSDPGEDGADSV